MKIKYIICFILVVIIAGCSSTLNEKLPLNINVSKEQESENMDAEDSGNNELFETESEKKQRLFIELEYLVSIENVDLSEWCELLPYINEDTEFTWWERIYTNQKEDSISNYFEFSVPENIDIAQKDFIVSYGRKLKYLYYEDEYIPEGLWDKEHYLAHPVFEREYQKNSAHIYLIDKIKLGDNEYLGSEMFEFNEKGNIPFEIPPEEDYKLEEEAEEEDGYSYNIMDLYEFAEQMGNG